MCGIVGAVAKRDVREILLEGLRRLEYRGYDSAGLALLGSGLGVRKSVGKIAALESHIVENPIAGAVGIAHTRWATHGSPSEVNAHPHVSGGVAVVHNGIIENHESLRRKLTEAGYEFVSDTDTEVIAHLLHQLLSGGTVKTLKDAVLAATAQLEGAYAIAVISDGHPGTLVATRSGSPLVVGVGIGENFVASDQMALRQVTDRFIFLEEGDLVELSGEKFAVFDALGQPAERTVETITHLDDAGSKGHYRHFMLKEIHEQPDVINATLQGRISDKHVLPEAFGSFAKDIFPKVANVHIVACGTSYHAGLVASYWLEEWSNLSCRVEVASEYRYRQVVVPENTLFLSISQSGETADTLAALRMAKERNYLGSLCICNVPASSLVRESDMSLMTQAGAEIGVASTKAFTTQLVALQLLAAALGRFHGMPETLENELVRGLHQLPGLCRDVLALEESIEKTFECFADKHHALFLGRNTEYPVALEGSLKLKEISYIHAEAYPAGELKHGPLALIDDDMPVVVVAPNNELLEKLKSNLHEVQARGGQLFVFADRDAGFTDQPGLTVIDLPHMPASVEPIVYTIPLQLLSYHVALVKGTDVDQPRNLAKSVTVE
ncbi:MAG: glutamine--fructose-6-phosphate transaminase (isomerizing) [bacterium]